MTSLCGSVRRCETAISGVLLCSFFIGFRDFFWHEGQGQLLRKQTFRYLEHSWRFATFDICYQILSYTILVSWCYPFPVPGLMRHGMDYTTIKPMTCSSLATMWTHIMVSNWKYLKMTLFQVGEHIMTQPGPCIPVLFLFYREIHQNYRELRFDFRKGFFLGLGEICCPTCPIAACSHVFPAFPPSKKGPQLLGVDVCGGEYHAECLGTLSTHRHRSEPRTSLFSLTGRMISTGNSPKA